MQKEQEQIKEYKIHRAINSPDLLFGCERKPLYMLGLLVTMLIFSALNIYLAITGVLLFFVGVYFLRKMAKADPYMSLVFLKALKYKRHYPARATPYAPSAIFKRKG